MIITVVGIWQNGCFDDFFIGNVGSVDYVVVVGVFGSGIFGNTLESICTDNCGHWCFDDTDRSGCWRRFDGLKLGDKECLK